MAKADMFYRLVVDEFCNGKKTSYKKYGITDKHAEDRARQVEHSARKNGHDINVRADGYYYNPSRCWDIGRAEHDVHSNRNYHHYNDGGNPFNGSTEIYENRDSRKIEKQLRKAGVKFKKCR